MTLCARVAAAPQVQFRRPRSPSAWWFRRGWPKSDRVRRAGLSRFRQMPTLMPAPVPVGTAPCRSMPTFQN